MIYVMRSQFWYDDKTWFSDSPNFSTATDRCRIDKENFCKATGLNPEQVQVIWDEATRFRHQKVMWKEKYGWTMEDLGSVQTNEFNTLTVMS